MAGGDSSGSWALALLVGAAAILASSGVPGLFLGWRSRVGARTATALTVAGSLVGLAGASLALASPAGHAGPAELAVAGSAPGASAGPLGPLLALSRPLPGLDTRLAVDALSAVFLVPVFLVGGLGSMFGASYWSPRRHPRHGRRLRFAYGVLLASLTLVLVAHGGIAFLVAWEGMALSTFFLVTTEESDAAAREAGWLYLLYSHAALLCLVALFLVARQASGELALQPLPATAPAGLRAGFFVLALVGFGIKAGLMPLHSWLPAAHASAPSHVSALMSGVAIKLGVYGLVRTCSLLEQPLLSWGVTILLLGSASAFFGVVYALGQHDLKRLLAYHSIENVGIMMLGLGLAMIGRTLGQPEWVLLGITGCLFHVWNHSLFKSLLFFGAGSVVHATGTREIERTGGLAKRMPATALFFLVGSIAICGLPPLNGFVSELLVYLGLVRAAASDASWAALPAPVLAATGALAVACFVKVYGIVFLGSARSPAAAAAHEPPPLMLAPMATLAAACVLLGLAPQLAAPVLDRAAAAWSGGSGPPGAAPSLLHVAPLHWISAASVALVVTTAILWTPLGALHRRARRRQPELPTWDCGYAATSPRLQYTASSFAQIITSHFGWALRPRVDRARIDGIFPAPASFHTRVDDALLDRLLAPAARRALGWSASVRALPRGQIQRYIFYIVAVVLPLLVWALAGSGTAP